jgi:hypothetical protein
MIIKKSVVRGSYNYPYSDGLLGLKYLIRETKPEKIKSSQKDENNGRKGNQNRKGTQPELRHLKGQCIHIFHLAPDGTRLVWSELFGDIQSLAGLCVRIKEPVQSVKST